MLSITRLLVVHVVTLHLDNEQNWDMSALSVSSSLEARVSKMGCISVCGAGGGWL